MPMGKLEWLAERHQEKILQVLEGILTWKKWMIKCWLTE
jgi:hypothetical protein